MRLRLFVAFAAISLAGPAALAAEPKGDALPWNLLDCVFVYGTAFVPAALLADRTPPGFRLMAAGTATAGHLTQLGFEVDVCAEGSGASGQLAPMTYASTWASATSTPTFSVPGYALFVNWDVIVPDDERRELMVARGTPAHEGDISISADVRAGMPVAPFTVDYDYSGVPFHFDIVPRGPTPGAGSGRFAQYTPGADGSLTFWKTDWAVKQGYTGVGTVTLAPESWQAQALGTTVLPLTFTYGTWDYTNGKIVLPN